MSVDQPTTEELLAEAARLRQRVVELEASLASGDPWAESDRQFRELVESSGIPAVIISLGEKASRAVVWSSPLVESSFGMSAERLVGEWENLVHPDDRAIVQHMHEEALAWRPTLSEYRIISPDGTPRWVLAYSRPSPARSSACPGRVYLSHRDLDSSRFVQQALLQSEAHRQAILGAIPDLVFRFDNEGAFLDVHAPLPEMLVLPAHELIGRRIPDIPELADISGRCMEALARTRATGELQEFYYDLTVQAGFRHFEARMTRVDAESVLLLVRDITERRRAQDVTETLTRLGERLSSASTAREVAIEVSHAAESLVPWDALQFSLLTDDDKSTVTVLIIDTIDGIKREFVEEVGVTRPLNIGSAQALESGAMLFTRKQVDQIKGVMPIGNRSRLSAQIMIAPLRTRDRKSTGVLGIHTYTPGQFTENDCKRLQLLSDHAGAALARVTAEEKARAAQARYRRAIEEAGLVPYERDLLNESFLFMGKGIERLTGIPAAELTTDRWRTIVREVVPLRELTGLTMDEAIPLLDANKINEWHADYRIECPDGTERWLTDASIFTYDEQGRRIGSLGTLQDITERKRVEGQLRRRERDYRSLATNSRDMIRRVDRTLRHIFVNPAMVRITNIPWERWINHTIHEVGFPRDVADLIHESVVGVFADGQVRHIEYELVVDGVVRTIEGRHIPEYDDQGVIQTVLVNARDITEQKQVEQSLRESEGRLRFILEHVPAILWVLDEHFILTFVAGRLLETMGMKAEDIVGKRFHDLLGANDPEENPGVAQHRAALRGESPAYDFEFGQWIIRTVLRPLRNAEGRVTGVLGVGLDITDMVKAEEKRRELEGQMIQAQRLESLGLLAGGIAHDFNNLLTGILGNTSLLMLDLENTDKEQYRMALAIERAATRAADLTQQMLAFAGRGQVKVEDIDIGELVKEMSELLSVSVRKNVTLELDLRDSSMLVRADASQMQQVIMNLITNASDAMPATGGAITVITRMERIRADDAQDFAAGMTLDPGRYAVVEVKDTGTGMDEETLARIFDPFFTTKFVGRGLGLAGVLGIVRSHSGAIRVQSTPNVGTTFEVLIPIHMLASTAAEVSATPQPTVATREVGTVLVVDDEETLRSLLKRVLTSAGYKVVLAISGDEALMMLDNADAPDIDAVVLDLSMPGRDGMQTMTEIHERFPRMPVLLMSGFAEQEVTEKMPDEPWVGFLHKPFRPAEVRQALKRVRAGATEDEESEV